jgi:hypothetical protein
VIVRTTDKYHRLATPPKVTDIEICRDISPKVPKVAGTIGIGKAAGDEDGAVAHHYLFDDDAINKVITMGKRLSFPTRSFGSDPLPPNPMTISRWVSERRGREGDLITCLLEQGIQLQMNAGISLPCSGGLHYRDRWKAAFTGLTEQAITAELGVFHHDVRRDAEDLAHIREDLWISVPAPHVLALEDRYYGNTEDADHAIFSVYKTLMREQRDVGIRGHVLLCKTVQRDELESLAGKKAFFFPHNLNRKSLGILLEYQQTVALKPGQLRLITDLMDEYEVHSIVLLDPEEQDLRQALFIRDPDQILCGGYCTTSCEEYWKILVEKSSILK